MKKAAIILAVTIAVIAAGVGGIELGRQAGWWGEPDELRAIKSESIVNDNPLGLTLISREESGKNNFLQKREWPAVTLIFKSNNPKETKQKIIEFAERDGWKYRDSAKSYDSWRANKNTDGKKLLLTIEAKQSSVNVRVLSNEND